MIDRPKREDDYPDRLLDCEQALEPLFQEIMETALAHGWGPVETRRALRRLIAAGKCADVENAKLEADLAIIRAQARSKD